MSSLQEIEGVWEAEIMLPKGDFNHLVSLSPDWPPHSEMVLMIYQLTKHGISPAKWRFLFKELRKRFGYVPEAIQEKAKADKQRREKLK
jgi:hypothetical protein